MSRYLCVLVFQEVDVRSELVRLRQRLDKLAVVLVVLIEFVFLEDGLGRLQL